MKHALSIASAAALCACAGCLAIKTEHEVKPIQITMDVNLKVDKALEQDLEREKSAPPKGFETVKALVEGGKVGFDERGYFVARAGLDPAETEAVEDGNAARRVRMAEIASQTGAARADVERRRAEKMRALLPAGAWYRETADGEWKRK